ncbi:MAG: hypothetical protein ABSH38_21825 [Verrucomicrobiota bacterium]|jgi:hypothetical protein
MKPAQKSALVVAVTIAVTVAGIFVGERVLESLLDLERPEAFVAATFGVLILVVAACWWLFINLPPICENRVCGPRDYTVVGLAGDFGIPGHEPVLQCRCGRRYLRRGNQFLSVNERNYLEKYMIKPTWYSRWTPDG